MSRSALTERARLALVGAAGAGKSAVAQELAARWECPVLDTDAIYAQQHGQEVAEAIIDDEAGFRAVEEGLVLEALRTPGAVVAVGSGATSDPVLQELRGSPVVWLEVGLADAARRTGLSGMRPLALGNVRAQLHQMLQERATVYASVADLQVGTDGRTVAEVADQIQEWEAAR